jgi:putative ABC transport system permease protein
MRARTAGKIAWSGLYRNKLRTFLMMAGIVVGIAALTMVTSAAVGARERVMERVKKFGLDSLMVSAGGGRDRGPMSTAQPAVTLKLEDAEAVRQEKGVREVAPFNRQSGRDISWRERSTSAAIFGVTPTWAPVWEWDARAGDFIDDEDIESLARVCILGETVRRELFPDSNPIGETIQIGNAPFRVKGIMEARGTSPGGGDMDNRVYIPLSTFMRRVANVDHLSGIKVRLRSVRDVEPTAEAIRELLRERHRLGPGVPDDFSVTTPDEVTEMASQVAGTFSILLVIVAGVSLLAGGVVVANIMLISVNERKHEIGLRKAVGAKSKDIRVQFLLEAVAITIAGGAVGVVLGYLGTAGIRLVTEMPAVVSWESLAIGIVFSGAVGILAGLHPARRAAALVPIEALRK